MIGPRGIIKDCGCGMPVSFTILIGSSIDGDPRIYTRGEISHIQFRGYPAQRRVYTRYFKVVGRFPHNVLEVGDAMEETLRFLLRETGCMSKRGGWES